MERRGKKKGGGQTKIIDFVFFLKGQVNFIVYPWI